MQLSDILSPDRIACNVDAQSKKRALEHLSQLVCNGENTISSTDVFNSLITRERMGCTGVGHGVAIPHGRLKNSSQTYGAFIRLKDAIDFDSADKQPVDLLFALLVPEESTEEHLQALAQLAAMFSNEEFREKLRSAGDSQQLMQLILDWQQLH